MKTNIDRRDFISTASTATLGALAAGSPSTSLATKVKEQALNSTADTVIVLWMAGGMASTDTFDPKRHVSNLGP